MKKYFQKYWLLIVFTLLLIAGYFIIRLPHLTLQPVFADEAIYIRWAQVMKAEPTLRFIPVSDGKTPLWMWILMPVFKFITDPLLAGRLLSVFCGLFTLLGVLFLGWKYFNWKTALWAGLLIVLTPYIIFFDRMALVDTFLAAFSMWSLIFTLLLFEYKRLDLAMILGGILGGGWLTKTPGLFAVLSLPLGFITFDWKKRGSFGLYKMIGLMIVSIVVALGFYNILRLGPGFDSLSSRNGDYIHSPLHVFSSPFDPFIPHFRDLVEWFPKFLSWPILILILGGIIWSIRTFNIFALTVLAWGLIPLLVEMALLKTFTTRYILFTIPPMLFLAGWFIGEMQNFVKKRAYLYSFGVFVVIFGFTMMINYPLVTNPESVNLPKETRRGYFEDWTAGYGLKEIAEFLKVEAKDKKVVVGTNGGFGTLPDGLFIYIDKEPNISVVAGKVTDVSVMLKESAKENVTYFVGSKSQTSGMDEHFTLVKQYPKAIGTEIPQDFMLLYKVSP